MLHRNILSVAVIGLLAATFGCEQTISGLGGKPSPVMPIGESHFLKVLANANQEDTQISNMALARSHNDQVRQFAQQMIDDHSQMQAKLQDLAASKQAVLPTVLGNIEQGVVTDLSSKPDSQFDQAYVHDEIAIHQNVVNAVEAESINGADVDVKAYAQQVLPNVEHELVMAKQLQQNVR